MKHIIVAPLKSVFSQFIGFVGAGLFTKIAHVWSLAKGANSKNWSSFASNNLSFDFRWSVQPTDKNDAIKWRQHLILSQAELKQISLCSEP